MIEDSRTPMTPKEVDDLLGARLHGPLPQATVYRMMATLGEWKDLAAALEQARAVNEAAVVWWESRRPTPWTKREHIVTPTINVHNDAERDLAMAVAGLLKASGYLQETGGGRCHT